MMENMSDTNKSGEKETSSFDSQEKEKMEKEPEKDNKRDDRKEEQAAEEEETATDGEHIKQNTDDILTLLFTFLTVLITLPFSKK